MRPRYIYTISACRSCNSRSALGTTQQQFDQVIRYIQESGVLDDVYSGVEIDVEKRKIYFTHSLDVMTRLLPDLAQTLGVRKGDQFDDLHFGDPMQAEALPFAEITINTEAIQDAASEKTASKTPKNTALDDDDVGPLTKIRDQLVETSKQYLLGKQSRQYLHTIPNTSTQKLFSISDTTDTTQLLRHLLSNKRCLAIGEEHYHGASKKLLMDNMAALKTAGVDTIFFEHIPITLSPALNHYLAQSTTEDSMPLVLQAFLEGEEKGRQQERKIFGKTAQKGALEFYNFTNLIRVAKQHGLNIALFDSCVSYSVNPTTNMPARCLMMNYLAAKAYTNYEKTHSTGKCIFFVGSAHLNGTSNQVPGIAEITGAYTVVVADTESQDVPRITSGETHPAKPDIVVTLDPHNIDANVATALSAFKKRAQRPFEHPRPDEETGRDQRLVNSTTPGSTEKEKNEIEKRKAIDTMTTIDRYIEMRRMITSFPGLNKEDKLSAANKLKKCIENPKEKQAFTKAELAAITETHSGKNLFRRTTDSKLCAVARIALGDDGIRALTDHVKLMQKNDKVFLWGVENVGEHIRKVSSTGEELPVSPRFK